MPPTLSILPYTTQHRPDIRRILERIGWAEQYIAASERNADLFSQNPEIYGAYVAVLERSTVGFLCVQYYAWNQLAQIQGLAVDPTYHRQGIASALVA